jgi:glycosyltransferase involved in cell wall biosynthesis
MTKISVIVCSHNPRSDYLSRVLNAVKLQRFPAESWELLLIDNGSTDPLAASFDLSTQLCRARHLREEDVGLTPARVRGIREAEGELLIFADDDNILHPDYLERAWDVASRYQHVGVFGAGTLEPEFETEPSRQVLSRVSLLAIRTAPVAMWSNNLQDASCIPWGAGLCVRRDIAKQYVGLIEQLRSVEVLDRRGEQLFSGGDDLFSWVAIAHGYGFGIFPELCVLHLIDKRRLDPQYLVRLIHHHSFSQHVLAHLLGADRTWADGWQDSTTRILLHGLRRGPFSMRCRWAALTGAKRADNFIAQKNLQPLSKALFPGANDQPSHSEMS